MNYSRRIAACTIGVAMFGAATFWAPRAEAATQSLGAVALASDEVTPTAAGDSGGTGTVDLRIDGTTGDVCVRAAFTGLSGPLTMAHIHSGAVGANGPVFITLPSTDTAVNGCVKATPAEAQAVLAAPGSFYFNAHTSASPGGAVRGQLTASVFNAVLTGAAEVPGPGAPNGTGSAVVAVDTSGNRACVLFTVAGVELPAAMAHIHSGAATVAGPVVVPLTAPAAATSASCGLAAPAVLAAIVASPTAHYANVHTTAFAAGAVRGQLAVRTVSDVPVPSGSASTTTVVSASTSTTVAGAPTTTTTPATASTTILSLGTTTTVAPLPTEPPVAVPTVAEPTFTG